MGHGAWAWGMGHGHGAWGMGMGHASIGFNDLFNAYGSSPQTYKRFEFPINLFLYLIKRTIL